MPEVVSFGAWLKRRRKALDLTQAALAQLVGCAVVSIRKIEADEQRPSRQTVERLALYLQIAAEQQAAFVQFARFGLEDIPPALPIPAAAQLPKAPPTQQTGIGGTQPASAAPTPRPHGRVTLPHIATPFIGRATEMAEIATLLNDPACRLLTLTGPGGIGKTRLALAAVAEQLGRKEHGVWFVNLAPLGSADGVVSTIADTFKLSALRVVDLKEAVRNYLREKALLLLLDNFEHVLEAAELVDDLLAAPGVQVVVTSRERLRVRAERVYEVRGLPFPMNARADADTFDAVRMFVACVRHTHPQYMLEAADTLAVAQICRLAAGLPLGIELAAAWVPTLPVAAIATELAASTDLLETTMRDVPERHRSARAVFEHSWNLLTVKETGTPGARFTRCDRRLERSEIPCSCLDIPRCAMTTSSLGPAQRAPRWRPVSEDLSVSVLLLEAGPDYRAADTPLHSRRAVPAPPASGRAPCQGDAPESELCDAVLRSKTASQRNTLPAL